jgi:hypothetical protein
MLKMIWNDKSLLTMTGIAVALVVAAVAATIYNGNQWKEFSQEHECKVVAKHAGTTGYGMTSTGKMGMVTTSATTSYLCNDGVTYTR